MQISLLYVTHPDKKHAEVLCKKLIDEHLIACANIFSIQSHYIWNGAHVDDGEFVSILKTLPQLVQKVRTRITELRAVDNALCTTSLTSTVIFIEFALDAPGCKLSSWNSAVDHRRQPACFGTDDTEQWQWHRSCRV